MLELKDHWQAQDSSGVWDLTFARHKFAAKSVVNVESTPLVSVARGQITRDLRAFFDIPADRNGGRRRATAVGLLETVIAAVEAGNHAGAPFAGGGVGIAQPLQ